jgi:hypothetical protein
MLVHLFNQSDFFYHIEYLASCLAQLWYVIAIEFLFSILLVAFRLLVVYKTIYDREAHLPKLSLRYRAQCRAPLLEKQSVLLVRKSIMI